MVGFLARVCIGMNIEISRYGGAGHRSLNPTYTGWNHCIRKLWRFSPCSTVCQVPPSPVGPPGGAAATPPELLAVAALGVRSSRQSLAIHTGPWEFTPPAWSTPPAKPLLLATLAAGPVESSSG